MNRQERILAEVLAELRQLRKRVEAGDEKALRPAARKALEALEIMENMLLDNR